MKLLMEQWNQGKSSVLELEKGFQTWEQHMKWQNQRLESYAMRLNFAYQRMAIMERKRKQIKGINASAGANASNSNNENAISATRPASGAASASSASNSDYLLSEITRLQQDRALLIAEMDRAKQRSQTEFHSIQRELASEKELNQQLSAQLEKCHSERDALQAKWTEKDLDWQGKFTAIQGELSRREDKIKELEREMVRFSVETRHLQRQLEVWKSGKYVLEEEKLSEMENILRRKEEEIGRMAREKEALKDRIAKLEKRILEGKYGWAKAETADTAAPQAETGANQENNKENVASNIPIGSASGVARKPPIPLAESERNAAMTKLPGASVAQTLQDRIATIARLSRSLLDGEDDKKW